MIKYYLFLNILINYDESKDQISYLKYANKLIFSEHYRVRC